METIDNTRITNASNGSDGPISPLTKSTRATEALLGVQEDVFRRPIPYFPYLVAAGALFKITGQPEYEQSIRKFFDHEKEQGRYWAEHELEIEGSTTTKRKAKTEATSVSDSGTAC